MIRPFKGLFLLALFVCPLSLAAKQIVLTQDGVIIDDRLSLVIETGINRNKPASRIKYTQGQLETLLREIDSSDRVISLGGNPNEIELLRKNVAPNLRIIYGAHTSGHDVPGINLLFDPQRLFAALKKTAPNIKSIRTVVTSAYSPEHLVFISERAKGLGLGFTSEVADDARSLASLWQSALDKVDPKSEALVIVDTSLMDKIAGLRFILKAAWRDKLIVLTTIPSYTNRGVSMGVAHNLEEYGLSLSKYASSNKTGTEYFSSYLPALNKRTLNHSGTLVRGLKYDNEVVFVE